MNAILEQWSERVRAAAAEGRSLRLRGGGSKDFYGQSLAGEVLDTRDYAGIVAYEPTELVVTVRCGTRLADLESALAEKGQYLAFEPPHFAAAKGGQSVATVGGMVAAGLSGPRRAQAGSVRDFVLGAKLIDGQGQVLDFGGQVMKNVAGYDVPRLLAGSLGTLGLIAEVSLKVLPFAVAERTLRFELPQDEALQRLNRWGGQPLPISASAWYEGTLHLRLSGAAAAVDAATWKLGGAPLEAAAAADFWTSLREQTHPFFAGDAPLWRLGLPSVTPSLGLPGEQLIEWGGAQRWLRGASAAESRAAAEHAKGHATLFRAAAAEKEANAGGTRAEASSGFAPVFQPLSAELARIHRNLKAAFDPQGVFNPGRMYRDF